MVTLDTLITQFKENPVNWALAAVLLYILKYFTISIKPVAIKPEHPETTVFRNYTPLELLPFDGKDGARIFIGVNGSVYDVSQGSNFYGPGGPYANFAGHDASRGLAKNSFEPDMMVDPHGPIDKLEDLAEDEWESLREWEALFAKKYMLVGKLVENTI
ncbi:cytochrome b5-like heme/steroid binding domain-containing protein [Choanephora cucurbitarum]|nr:cytochrome b5-like heme/steroid binding domain-containing protein [Choanephora cucurbitarum]